MPADEPSQILTGAVESNRIRGARARGGIDQQVERGSPRKDCISWHASRVRPEEPRSIPLRAQQGIGLADTPILPPSQIEFPLDAIGTATAPNSASPAPPPNRKPTRIIKGVGPHQRLIFFTQNANQAQGH
jgi:hypothetical protein